RPSLHRSLGRPPRALRRVRTRLPRFPFFDSIGSSAPAGGIGRADGPRTRDPGPRDPRRHGGQPRPASAWRRLGDRYHARSLSTPREVRNALVYVLNNWRKHVRGAPGLTRARLRLGREDADVDAYVRASGSRQTEPPLDTPPLLPYLLPM